MHGWQTLAWNGVRLPLPAGWEPAQLERLYLRAGDGEGSAMEVKWQHGKSISRKKALKRLARALKGVDARMGPEGLPRPLARACKDLERRGFAVSPFSWSNENTTAAGALMQCGVCGRSSLVQFVGTQAPPEEAGDVLAGFADHEDDGGARFELFGIRARAPSGFTLKRFSFKPGQYRMEFEGDRSRRRAGLVLERVGPASVLLAGEPFATWAAQRFATKAGDGSMEHESWQRGPAVRWQPARRGVKALLHRLVGSRKLAHVRAWQPAGSNAVLCVALSGGGRLAHDIFEEVCSSYVLAQET